MKNETFRRLNSREEAALRGVLIEVLSTRLETRIKSPIEMADEVMGLFDKTVKLNASLDVVRRQVSKTKKK